MAFKLSFKRVELAESSGYTGNGISSADVNGPDKPSALHQSRKLLAVFGVVNGLQCPGLLVDCGSPVTLIRIIVGTSSSATTNF